MIGFLKGLVVTLKTTLRHPVTAQYPDPDQRLDIADRFMGFPALTWDSEVGEPYCTGCMVCIRYCPTQCMSAEMMDNPRHAEGKSRRRKIIKEFEINLGRCILCRICVDVCNFDAIEMGHDHELSKYERNGNRVDLDRLLEMGTRYQAETGWRPRQPEKNSGVPVEKKVAPKAESGVGEATVGSSPSKGAPAKAEVSEEAPEGDSATTPQAGGEDKGEESMPGP